MTRTKQFDPDEVLERAMRLFWAQGYEATSIQDLVDAMGINRFSLYATFGDKHALYLAVCEKYCRTITPNLLADLETGAEGLSTIRNYFDVLLRGMESSNNGCLMVNSAIELAPHDPEVATHVGGHFDRVEKALLAALKRAQSLGQLEPGTHLRPHAQHLTLVMNGLLVSLKGGGSAKAARQAVKTALSALPTTA